VTTGLVAAGSRAAAPSPLLPTLTPIKEGQG
jgi:hypothetical protein